MQVVQFLVQFLGWEDPTPIFMGFPGGSVVQTLPAMRETWVRSLSWKDPLEEGMATYSNILAWRIAVDRGAWRAAVHGAAESDTTECLSTAQHSTTYISSLLMARKKFLTN